MNILTTKEINKALLLKVAFRNEIKFSGVSIDTRTIKKGNLFIPIKGKNYDGHNYIGEAFEKGAYASLVEFKKKRFLKNDKRLIYVKSTIDSLHKLAKFSRNRVKDYEITFAETLQIDKEEELFDYLATVYENTDRVANESFAMSFGDAKKEKISTAVEYIKKIINKDYSIAKYKKINKELLNSIDIFYKEVNKWIEKDLSSRKTVPEIMKTVEIAYLILVSSEIFLFLIVSSIDIINNNVNLRKKVGN